MLRKLAPPVTRASISVGTTVPPFSGIVVTLRRLRKQCHASFASRRSCMHINGRSYETRSCSSSKWTPRWTRHPEKLDGFACRLVMSALRPLDSLRPRTPVIQLGRSTISGLNRGDHPPSRPSELRNSGESRARNRLMRIPFRRAGPNLISTIRLGSRIDLIVAGRALRSFAWRLVPCHTASSRHRTVACTQSQGYGDQHGQQIPHCGSFPGAGLPALLAWEGISESAAGPRRGLHRVSWPPDQVSRACIHRCGCGSVFPQPLGHLADAHGRAKSLRPNARV